jgi:hypothetical protein
VSGHAKPLGLGRATARGPRIIPGPVQISRVNAKFLGSAVVTCCDGRPDSDLVTIICGTRQIVCHTDCIRDLFKPLGPSVDPFEEMVRQRVGE